MFDQLFSRNNRYLNYEQYSQIVINDVSIAKEKSQQINKHLICIFVYIMLQLILVLILLTLYVNNPIDSAYLFAKMLQYLFDLYFLNRLRLDNNLIIQIITSNAGNINQIYEIRILLQPYRDGYSYNMWGRLIFRSVFSFKINILVTILLFIVGHILYLYDLTKLSIWVFIIQFIFIWLLFFITLLLLILVVYVYIRTEGTDYFQNQERINRQNQLEQGQRYDSLNSNLDCICPICQQKYHNEDLVIRLPCNIHHIFHQQCIKTWSQVKPICPICRVQIF